MLVARHRINILMPFGGGVEDGETYEEALWRELEEE
jgi:ADP-ribose pyrophosphatase YjhB (NUDIX family)